MAGNGGFKSALNGFDRNEVNEYIGEMSRKIQEREMELRDKEAKAAAAEKAAAEAEAMVKSLQESHAAKVLELEAQIKTERRNSDTLQNDIDELKRKLRNAGSSNGGVNTAEAEKRAAEIVENANAKAQDIVDKAKKTAQQIIASAENAGGSMSGGGVSAESLEVFGDILGKLTGTITDALKAANDRASSISVSASGAPVHIDIPDFSNISAPQAAVPVGHSAKPVPKTVDNVDDVFADMMDDNGDMADFGDFKPLDSAKSSRGSIDAFDLSGMDEMSVNSAPAKEKPGGLSMDDLGVDLFAQTVPGDSLDNDLFGSGSDDLFAGSSSDSSSELDMGTAESGLDAMNALLGQMGAVLESAGGSAGDFDMGRSSVSESNDLANDNPWADFQNEIKAMEQSGNFGSAPEDDIFVVDAADDPKTPDADDSSIWNFDDMSSGGDDDMNSGSDDDMSSDLFGSF